MSDNAYADAIVVLADGSGVLDLVDKEVSAVAQAIVADRTVLDRLADSSMPVGDRLKAVETRALGAAHPVTRAALAMVIAGGQAGSLDQVADLVSVKAAQRRDAELAEVTVAEALTDQQRDALLAALEAKLRRKLSLKVTVDPDVIGGVRARVGDTVIDGSLAGRLSAIRARVAG